MSVNKRVPQKKTSKSAFEENRRTEFYCCRCGKSFTRQQTNFPTSKSALYAGNNGYLTICKTCMTEIFLYYLNELNDPFLATERVCSRFDIYYSKEILEAIIASCAPEVMITSYIGRVNVSEHKNKCYDDYIEEAEKKEREAKKVSDKETSEYDSEIVEQGKIKWGLTLEADDYVYLDNEFADWNARCAVDGKARESLVREILVLVYSFLSLHVKVILSLMEP